MDKIIEVSLSAIEQPKEEVRLHINADAIRELAESIKEKGLLQPILLRKNGDRYEVVAGHRRYLAHEMLGLKKIKAVVRVMNDEECFQIRATENLQRADLSPIEEGLIYETMRTKYGMSVRKISKSLGRSQVTILQRLKMLELDDFVQRAVHERSISARAVETLIKIEDKAVRQMYLRSAIENGASVKTCLFWLNEYRRAIEGQKQSEKEEQISQGHFPEKVEHGTCDVCRNPYERTKMRVVVVCPDCLKIIQSS